MAVEILAMITSHYSAGVDAMAFYALNEPANLVRHRVGHEQFKRGTTRRNADR